MTQLLRSRLQMRPWISAAGIPVVSPHRPARLLVRGEHQKQRRIGGGSPCAGCILTVLTLRATDCPAASVPAAIQMNVEEGVFCPATPIPSLLGVRVMISGTVGPWPPHHSARHPQVRPSRSRSQHQLEVVRKTYLSSARAQSDWFSFNTFAARRWLRGHILQ